MLPIQAQMEHELYQDRLHYLQTCVKLIQPGERAATATLTGVDDQLQTKRYQSLLANYKEVLQLEEQVRALQLSYDQQATIRLLADAARYTPEVQEQTADCAPVSPKLEESAEKNPQQSLKRTLALDDWQRVDLLKVYAKEIKTSGTQLSLKGTVKSTEAHTSLAPSDATNANTISAKLQEPSKSLTSIATGICTDVELLEKGLGSRGQISAGQGRPVLLFRTSLLGLSVTVTIWFPTIDLLKKHGNIQRGFVKNSNNPRSDQQCFAKKVVPHD